MKAEADPLRDDKQKYKQRQHQRQRLQPTTRETICGELVWADDFVGDGFHLSECGHGFEDLEVGLNVGPLLWIFFGGDGGQGVGVEVFDVVFELYGDWGGGVFG